MKHLHIALIDPTKQYAKSLGKKTQESDYTIYNAKDGEVVLCVYEPHTFPDKVQSLLHTLNSSDFVVWVVNGINADFAEIALALMMLNKPGLMILEGMDESQIAPYLGKSALASWPKLSGISHADLRAKILQLPEPVASGPRRAVVDACFAVGGVGTVALTKVEMGPFSVHDELEITPSKKKTAIRSIQIQDADAKEAPTGSRAGFAMKNIEADDARRGSYLAAAGAVSVFSLGEAKVELSPMVKESLSDGDEVFFSFGLQYVSGKLRLAAPLSGKDGVKAAGFSLLTPSAGWVGESFFLVRANKRPRVIGKGTFNALK